MKKNKLFVGVICLLVLVSITGCGKKTNLSNKKQSDNTETKTEVKAKINDGVSYADFKNAVGGVDGTLYELGSWNKYVWVAGDGSSNVTASFGKDGNLKFFSGLGFKS